MNIARLQQAIDRIVPIRARTLGIEFQAAPCDGAYLLLHDSKGERRELKRLHLYRPCAPTQDAVTDTTIEMLSRIHERFGPGKVWTLGNDGASKRIHVLADEGRARTNDDGEIMLRMLYVHEHSTIGPYEEDPESKWPWGEVPRRYLGKSTDGYVPPWQAEAKQVSVDREDEAKFAAIEERARLGRWAPLPSSRQAAILADMTPEQRRVYETRPAAQGGGWERQDVDGSWVPCNERGDQLDGRPFPGADRMGSMRYKVVTGSGNITIKGDASVPVGMMKIEGSADGDRWYSLDGKRKPYAPTAIGHYKIIQQAPKLYDAITRETDRAIAEMQARRASYLGAKLNAVHESPDIEPPALYDGLTAEQCLLDWLNCRSIIENGRVPMQSMTPAQTAAAKALWAAGDGAWWSAQLRAKVAAAKERERRRVTVDMELD